MRHSWSISDSPDLPIRAFHKALGKNRPATLEGGKGGGPSAPNPWEASAAQTAMNRDTAVYNKALNLGNYSNPFGSQQSSFSGYDPVTGAPIYQTNISANPELQQQLNNVLGQTGQGAAINQSALGGLYGLNAQAGSLGNQLGALSPQYGVINSQLSDLRGSISPEAAQQAQLMGRDAAYQAQSQYLDPQFSQGQESLEAKLAAQGLAPGSQAYSNAMLNFQNQKQRAYSDAANQAIMTGSQIGTQNWQNQLAGQQANAGLLGQMGQNLGAQSGLIGQQSGLVGQQAGLMGQMTGIGQIPYSNLQSIASMIPGYSGTAQSATNPADIMGAMNNQYQGQLGQYNARQQSSNANTAALAGLAGTAAMMFF
jgi:hypothetical protein